MLKLAKDHLLYSKYSTKCQLNQSKLRFFSQSDFPPKVMMFTYMTFF